MTPRPSTVPGRTSMPSAHLIAMLGMSQSEAAAYLTASGYPTSLAAIRAWARDTYPAPLAPMTFLWRLWLYVRDGSDLPEDVPRSVRDRRDAILNLMKENLA
jgi:hypothetical protein